MSSQESSEKKNLVVYKASAGSGKTHQLTAEYLQLLFKSPVSYKHILAVTFTNKATEEMKKRIISELSLIASGKESEYLTLLIKTVKKPEELIRSQAKVTLTNILHDYSAFSVSTIDRFFQQTMRAFTREIGLGAGYNVELDAGKVLGEAIDSMLYDLERSHNQQLLNWLIRFSEEKIENGETWNIRNDIQALSSEIFKESYKAYSDDIQTDITNKGLMDDYKIMLIKIIQSFEKESQKIAERGLNIIAKYGLSPDQFKNGSRSPFFSFLRWTKGEMKEPTATFRKLADDISNWYTKTTEQGIKFKIEEAYNNGLNDCVKKIIEHYNHTETYQTAYEINRYFFALGILSDVDRKIREYAAENNIMLISDTTELLNKIIQGADSPFIYEKVGTRIDNYMIDEFQDTSGMQWTNFLPLVRDSLSAGNRNLIVGDVKQSIYRWRNSDWKLLDEQIDKDLNNNKIQHQSLINNWRSSKHIVDFNNTIFEAGALLLQNTFNMQFGNDLNAAPNYLKPFFSKIVRAYADSYQHIPPKRNNREEGYVNLNFIDTDEHSNWQGQVLETLPQTIEDLQDSGYNLKDIAILVRTKREGAEIANCLLEYKGKNTSKRYKYDIISDEALYIRNAKSIKLVISILKYLHNPSNNTLRALAIYEYYKFKDQLNPEEAIRSHFSLTNVFPEEIEAKLNLIRNLPLYEMTEEIFNLFHDAMEQNEHIYIQAFLDMVLDFTVKKSSDLDLFLNWWSDYGQTQTIFTPDGQDAIRIMTIHKAKGLGFKVVIIPFCNWEIDHKLSTILWCEPKISPFDKLRLVPIRYSQKLQHTIFAYEYFDEKLHAYIDNLNILYVAFTRAKDNLIIFSPKPKEKQKDINSISSLLWAVIHSPLENKENKLFINLSNFISETEYSLSIGNCQNSSKIRDDKKNDYELAIENLQSIPFEGRLKLRLSNKHLFGSNGQREYGSLMHEILSKVDRIKDLSNVVKTYREAGEITEKEQTEINTLLSNYLNQPNIKDWYSNDFEVLNEIEILQPNGHFVRPDRIMIDKDKVVIVDYKFGEKENKKYIKQIKDYINQIRKMGYQNVRGYISYVTLGILQAVE